MSNKTAAYFAPLVSLPTLISAPDSYVTRDGKVVSVSAVSDRHDFGCVGTYSNGIRESWHRSGPMARGYYARRRISTVAPSIDSAAARRLSSVISIKMPLTGPSISPS